MAPRRAPTRQLPARLLRPRTLCCLLGGLLALAAWAAGSRRGPFLKHAAGPAAFLVVGSAPKLGLGLAALGRPGYINLGRDDDLAAGVARTPETMRQRAWEVLDAAWALGVRYFDCARSYGRSEEFLSGWLQAKGLSKEEVAVGSKWGYRYTAGWRVDTGGEPHEIKDHSLMHLERQQEETQGLLGEHLRLYQIHSATLESGVLEDKGVLQALRGLREERGWRIGLSLSGVKQGATLEKALETKVFDSVQATWNLLEQSAGPALERAKEEGLEVIVKEAMANGRLLRRPELAKAAEALGVAPDALALGAVMAQGFEPMVLSGAVTAAQLESNLGAVAAAEKLKEDGGQRLEQLMAELRQEPSSYWQERSELEWQ